LTEDFSIKISFADNAVEMLYSEGVLPAQGARPTLSTVSDLIGARIPQWTTRALTSSQVVDRIEISFEKEKELKATGYNQNQIVFESRDPVELRAGDLLKVQPSELQKRIAFHEAGHAIVGTFLMKMLPISIYSRSSDPTVGGFVRFPGRGLQTKTEMLQELAMSLGGLAAEEIMYGADGISPGASSDIKMATDMIGAMMQDLAMGSHIGQTSDIMGSSSGYTMSSDRELKEADLRAQEQYLKRAFAEAKFLLLQQKPQLCSCCDVPKRSKRARK
jgi:hypothetical protein